ncbi:MAG: pantetheine-phosphate adenylyltransferase [Lachnospiraceae bacterium]|nr:pantetheine-phosphate adenylyltransferase [Lachnospiraceae bacterium]
MKSAIYPGTFDPMTYGHLDIIKRAANIFDEVIVSVLDNKEKTPLFSVDERVKILRDVTADIPNVKIESFGGLLSDYCSEKNIFVVVRGLRAVTDFEYELQMSQMNRKLSNNKLDTVYLNTSLKYSYLSSSSVKQIAQFNGDLSDFVPDFVAEMLIERLGKKNQ